MANMLILLVAPKNKALPVLPWVDQEIQAIVNSGLTVQLERDVNERLLSELLGRRQWDIVWFASHGTSTGVALSDGIISTEALASMLRSVNVRYVVLNTCESVHVAAAISEEADCDVICTISPTIEDKQAWLTASNMARRLAAGDTVFDAFKRSRPTQPGKYIYLPGSGGFRTTLHQQVARLTSAIESGDPEGVERIVGGLADLGKRVGDLEISEERQNVLLAEHTHDIAAIQRKLAPPLSAILFAVAAIVVFIVNTSGMFWLLNNEELWPVLSQEPVIVAGFELAVVALIVTWTRQAILISRGEGAGR